MGQSSMCVLPPILVWHWSFRWSSSWHCRFVSHCACVCRPRLLLSLPMLPSACGHLPTVQRQPLQPVNRFASFRCSVFSHRFVLQFFVPALLSIPVLLVVFCGRSIPLLHLVPFLPSGLLIVPVLCSAAPQRDPAPPTRPQHFPHRQNVPLPRRATQQVRETSRHASPPQVCARLVLFRGPGMPEP